MDSSSPEIVVYANYPEIPVLNDLIAHLSMQCALRRYKGLPVSENAYDLPC